MYYYFNIRETATGAGPIETTTQGVTTSGTTPDDWLPGCPCNGLENMDYAMCMMGITEDPNPYDPGLPGMNSLTFRSKSCYQ